MSKRMQSERGAVAVLVAMVIAAAGAASATYILTGRSEGGVSRPSQRTTTQGGSTHGSGTSPAGSKSRGSATVSTTGAAGSTAATALCSDQAARVEVASSEGAAGTIGTVWRITNTSDAPCHSYAYPGMDFHTSSGWLDAQVQRGGYPNIDQAPTPVVLAPGQSMYFQSYWGDATTDAGNCQEFDRVKVTLPDNYSSAVVTTSGCVDPQTVHVGPVTTTRPA